MILISPQNAFTNLEIKWPPFIEGKQKLFEFHNLFPFYLFTFFHTFPFYNYLAGKIGRTIKFWAENRPSASQLISELAKRRSLVVLPLFLLPRSLFGYVWVQVLLCCQLYSNEVVHTTLKTITPNGLSWSEMSVAMVIFWENFFFFSEPILRANFFVQISMVGLSTMYFF